MPNCAIRADCKTRPTEWTCIEWAQGSNQSMLWIMLYKMGTSYQYSSSHVQYYEAHSLLLYHEHPKKRKILGFYNVRDPVADGLVHRNVRYVHRRRLIYRTCRLSPSLGKSEAYVAGSHNLRPGLQWLTTDV